MSDVRSLSDILVDHKIRLKSQRPGGTTQVICPKCEGGRTKELSLSVTVDADGMGAVWTCHRGSCGWTDGARWSGADRPIERDRPIVKPTPAPLAETEYRPQWFWDFWAERKIGMNTIKQFGVYAAVRNSKTLGESHPFIVFPYTFGGELVNRKYRPFPEKQPQMQDRDALQTLYNIDRLGDDPPEIVVVEGEPDSLAMFECGIPHAVSLKDGAPAKLSDNPNPNDKRFEALRTHSAMLTKAPRIVLGGDNDEPGRVLREELARRLGRHRCHIVEWPEGCKDACDVLRQHGPETVWQCVRDAQPYPIEGLQRITKGMLRELRRLPRPGVMTTGVSSIDDLPLRLPTEGAVIIVSGYPGSGKAMALDTPILTTIGWKTMGTVVDGDRVFAADGTPTTIIKAHDVLHDRECFAIKFADGAEFTCDAEHLWLTHTAASRLSQRHSAKNWEGRKAGELKPHGLDQSHLRILPSVKTTREIASSVTAPDGPGKVRFNHSVDNAAPIEGTAEWPLSVRPYTLGAWLGDGTSASAGLTSDSSEIPNNICSDGYVVSKGSHILAWYIQSLKGLLREAGVLGNKHIPADCFRAPLHDRLALLQGLMDTDGWVGLNGHCEFTSTKPALADGFLELVRSLGIKASMIIGRATIYGRDCGPKYRIHFTPGIQVFRLAKKAARLSDAPSRFKRPRRDIKNRRMIVSVEPTPSVPVRCLTVDHPSSLFLVGRELVPTHNTAFVRFEMIHTMKHYGRKWGVFSPEMSPWQQFVVSCAEPLIGHPFYPEPGYPRMTDEEADQAEEWLRSRITMLVCDAEDESPSMEWILEHGRAAILRDGITDLLIDPWNEMDHSRPNGLTETEYVGRSLQRFRSFSLRHGCNVWIIAHPKMPQGMKQGEKPAVPTAYSISGSSNWYNKADLGITIHRPSPGMAELHLWKSRHRRWGEHPKDTLMNYDPVIGRYSAPSDDLPTMAKMWNEPQ